MTSRRGFLRQMLRLGVGAALLPQAVTYKRQWKRPKIALRECDKKLFPYGIPFSIEHVTDPDTGLSFIYYKYPTHSHVELVTCSASHKQELLIT